ncbi:hypothetical protein Syun_014049 [Stephania yunnanensis]|uniref:Uncharacterized protein n=1 Tax=Stephania yunnanensis TaxID=152371 RepID=A0AAP0JJ06_9MAGN
MILDGSSMELNIGIFHCAANTFLSIHEFYLNNLHILNFKFIHCFPLLFDSKSLFSFALRFKD